MTTVGYFEEYFVNGKFIGTLNCNKQPNRVIGWSGKKEFKAIKTIKLERGKKIKPGQVYSTRYYPLNGR